MSLKTPQPLTGSNIVNLLKLLTKNKIEKQYWTKLFALLFWSALLAPLYLLEAIVFALIAKRPFQTDPIFIIGHWRSGTTYLHYLLSKDKQFGYCSNSEAFVPGALLIGRNIVRKILTLRLPKTRPMDEVRIQVDSPQEDEFAMMLLTTNSCYHGFVFPESFREKMLDYIVLDNTSVRLTWVNRYYEFLSKLSYYHNGKTLLLKNPVNTSRIRELLTIFPNAKFIYLYRDAEEVRRSTLRMFAAMSDISKLQSFDQNVWKQHVHELHRIIIKEYEKQRQLINPGNLVEVKYSDLVEEPLTTVKKIYEELNIPGFDESRAFFEKEIESQKNYRPHTYTYN